MMFPLHYATYLQVEAEQAAFEEQARQSRLVEEASVRVSVRQVLALALHRLAAWLAPEVVSAGGKASARYRLSLEA